MNVIQPFITQHPWMTFFIVLAALQVVGNVFQFATAVVLRGRQ